MSNDKSIRYIGSIFRKYYAPFEFKLRRNIVRALSRGTIKTVDLDRSAKCHLKIMLPRGNIRPLSRGQQRIGTATIQTVRRYLSL